MMNKSEVPLVSIIMTVYNGENYIEEALKSVADQKYPNKEIIVIDDGSTDRTAKIVKNFPFSVKYEYQENKGIAAGWNRGVEKARGEFLTFIDSDDKWTNNKLEMQVKYLLENGETDILFGYVMEFLSPELPPKKFKKSGRGNQSVPGISAGTMMINRNRFMDVGLFDPKWRKGIFSDWYLRATELGLTIYVTPEILLHRRIHDTNHGVIQRDKYIDYIRMLKASLDRKRED